jgi:Protein of unknown function (DUF1403)
MQSYRTSTHPDKWGGLSATNRDKPPPPIHHCKVIRAELTLVPDPLVDLGEAVPALGVRQARERTRSLKAPEILRVPPPAAVPAWARASGRAGESKPLFSAGASLALLDAHVRRDPPAAGALRARLALQSAAASARVLRLNADVSALRDLRFAAAAAPLPAAKLLQLWQELAARTPGLDARRLAAATKLFNLSVAAPDGLAKSLSETARAGDPVSAAAKAAAVVFAAVPDAPAAERERSSAGPRNNMRRRRGGDRAQCRADRSTCRR